MKRGLRSRALVQKKRKILLQKFTALSFIIVFILSSYSVLSQLKSITISTIEVQGNNVVSVQELTTIAENELAGNYWYLFSKSNIALYSEKNITASVYDLYKRIKKIDVGRRNLQTIYMRVEEREPYALWCTDVCYFLDDRGYIFAEAPEFTSMVYFTYEIPLSSDPIGTQLFTEKEFSEIELLLKSLRDLGLVPIKISLIDEIDFEVQLEDESAIMFSRNQDFAEVFDNLESVYNEIDGLLEYIDFRFGSKVYYRYVE